MPKLESLGDTKYQLQLPTVSFRVIDDDPALLRPAGSHSEQSRNYGYNDFSEFARPDYYIRHIEPIESELAVQVEYDMDEQDQDWIDAVNAERKREQSGAISYEIFEILMDKLEKEWFNLVKRIPQPASHLPVEDSMCAICDDGEGENSNAIVFCDGCNLAVHQDCYGVPYIPEGQWLCRKCTVSPENPVSCLFCPNEGGAFKQTSSGYWAHLLCAMFIPETSVGNAIYMEPVEGTEMIPKSRWKLVCSLCREKSGACIQCDNRNCFVAFHVTCARQMGYLMSMKSLQSEGHLRAFCDKHLPDDLRKEPISDMESDYEETPVHSRKARRRNSHTQNHTVTTKSARAHAKSYRPGPPIVPHLIVQKLLDYVAKVNIRKRVPFVERLCRYWSLKREARRGAPLLKRLHLEPWTASNAAKQQTEAEKTLKLTFLKMLRNDLEKVRMLAEQVRKREREKLRQAQIIKEVVDDFIFAGYGKLRLALEKITAMDRHELFLHPVNRTEVPDYYEVIKEPMTWLQIDDKLEKNQYNNLGTFKINIMLVLDNAMRYNSSETQFHKVARRIKSQCQPILEQLESLTTQSSLLPDDNNTYDLSRLPDGVVGDLEPSVIRLKAMINRNESGEKDLLQSLFTFELEPPRPPTPPPPSPLKKTPRPKITAAERKKRWEEKEAAHRERMAARSTRAADAAKSAFMEEAGITHSRTDTSSSRPSRPSRSSGRSGEKAKEEDEAERLERKQKAISRQRGVVGLETVQRLSDKQRRAEERALDLVTEEVGDRDQFKRFNVGWVLPEGSKRRRANALEGSTSARGTVSASPQIPLKSLPPIESSPLTDARSDSLTPVEDDEEVVEDVEMGDVEEKIKPSSRGRKRKTDYPPTIGRRRKRRRSQAGLDAENATAEEGEEEVEEELSPVPDEEVLQEETDLAATEILDEDEDEDAKAEEEEEEEGDGEDAFPASTLVWAKIPTFPYYPASVVDLKEEGFVLQPSVAKIRPSGDKGRHWLVRFFDKQDSFAWVSQERLDMLGEENDIDEMYLAGKERGKLKSFKNASMKKQVQTAYREAIATMALTDEE